MNSEVHAMKYQTFPCFLDLLVFEILFMKIDVLFGRMMLSRGTVFSIINLISLDLFIYIYVYLPDHICYTIQILFIITYFFLVELSISERFKKKIEYLYLYLP